MTPEELIAEGRKLEHACAFLRPVGTGPVAAIWHERDVWEEDVTGERCWITFDARQTPGLSDPIAGYVSVFTNEETCEGGRVEIAETWPSRTGTELYAHVASVLPPIDAVFAFGSEAVEKWIRSLAWERGWAYNNNFKGREVVEEYERVWQRDFPLYFRSDIYAVLGGWHVPWPDGDWDELHQGQLMLFTLRDSEPWVEAWRTRNGEFRVIQRIT